MLVETAAIVNIKFKLIVVLLAMIDPPVLQLNLPDFLLIARLVFAFIVLFCTELSVHPLLDKYRFESCVSKDNSCCKKAVYDSEGELNCVAYQCCDCRASVDRGSPIRFVDETSSGVIGSSRAFGNPDSIGLKLIFRCSADTGEDPLRCSHDSMDETR